jgi:hypothetical protein
VAKHVKAEVAECIAAVADAEEVTGDLVEQVRMLTKARNDLQRRVRELEAELERERASRRMFEANRTSDARELGAKFDPRDTTRFDDSDAGRKQFSRAMEVIMASFLKVCLAPRGSRAEGEGVLTASPAKKQMIVAKLLDEVLPHSEDGVVDADPAFNVLFPYLPRRFQVYVRALESIKNSAKKVFDVVKFGRSTEHRLVYYVLAASCMPPCVAEGDRSGLMRRVASMLGVPRFPGSVPHKQQIVRGLWDEDQRKSGPLAIGEKVECTAGPGTVEALNRDGGITIKLEMGSSKTFESQGKTSFSLPPQLAFNRSKCFREFNRGRALQACGRVVLAAYPRSAQRQAGPGHRGHDPRSGA